MGKAIQKAVFNQLKKDCKKYITHYSISKLKDNSGLFLIVTAPSL